MCTIKKIRTLRPNKKGTFNKTANKIIEFDDITFLTRGIVLFTLLSCVSSMGFH